MYIHIQVYTYTRLVYTGNYLTACFPNINFFFIHLHTKNKGVSLFHWWNENKFMKAMKLWELAHFITCIYIWKICFGFSIMSFKQWYVNCLGTELCLFKCSLQRAELDAMSRIRYLGSTVSSFAHTESNEDWVSHFDQYVVYTIDMDIFDPSGLHILQYTTFMQSPVQASITIYWSQISKQPWPFII